MLAVLLSALVSSSPGTPPDIMTSELVMLGRSDSAVAFMVRTGFNHGSHYLWEVRWFMLLMEIDDLSFSWVGTGSVMYAEEDFGGIGFEPPVQEVSIPQLLEIWGCTEPLGFRGTPWITDQEEWYAVRDSLLAVGLGDRSIPLPGARCFDPVLLSIMGTDFQQYYLPDTSTVIREVEGMDGIPRFFDFSTGFMELSVRSAADVDDMRVMIVGVPDEAVPFELIMVIPLDELGTALDSLHSMR